MQISRQIFFSSVLIGALVALMGASGQASAAITEPTWQTDEVLPGASTLPRPYPTTPSAMLPLSGGGYLLNLSNPVPTGLVEYASDGTFVREILSGYLTETTGAGEVTDAAQAADGSLWLTDQMTSRVIHITRTGEAIWQTPSPGSAPGEFVTPAGIDVASDGTIVVADLINSRIQRLSASGAPLAIYGSPGAGNGEFIHPTGLEVVSDGTIFIVDAGNSRIQHLAADGTYLGQWGTAGNLNGEFNGPLGMTEALNGDLLVADTGNDRVQRFTQTGVHVRNYGSGTWGSDPGDLRAPINVAQLPDGTVMVAEDGAGQISLFSDAGTFLSTRGAPALGSFRLPFFVAANASNIYATALTTLDGTTVRIYPCGLTTGCAPNPIGTLGFGPGQLGSSGAIGVAADGTLWVADATDSEIFHLAADGTTISTIQSGGSGPGQFDTPTAIEVDPDGTLWIADSSNQRIQHIATDGSYLGHFSVPLTQQIYTLERLSDGSFLVGALADFKLTRIRQDGTIVWTKMITDRMAPLQGLDLGDGTALIGALTSRAIQISLTDGSTVRELNITDGQRSAGPMGFAKLGDGTIIAADGLNSRLIKISLHQPPALVVTPPWSIPSATAGTGTLSFAGAGGSGGGYSYSASWLGGSAAISSSGELNLSLLPEGRGTLRVIVRDSAGNDALWEQAFVVDRTAPQFSSSNKRFTIRGKVTLSVVDALGIPTTSSKTIRLTRGGTQKVRARLTDSVGNSAVRTFRVVRRPSLASGTLNGGFELWRPGSTFTPGAGSLTDVFGNGSKNTGRARNGRARSPYAPALVREVQYRLKQSGHMSVMVKSSGSLDVATRQALRRYQRASGLRGTRVPDLATRKSLDNMLESTAGLREIRQ